MGAKSMKKILVIAVSLVASLNAVAAHATSASDSWANVFADQSLIVSTPFSGTFGPLGIFNACATDKAFVAISPVKACAAYVKVPGTGDNYPDHYDCIKYEMQTPSMPRTSTNRVCVQQDMSETHYPDCLKWENVTTTLPTTMDIEVVYNGGSNYASTAFTKKFTIPSCPQ